MKNFFKSFFAKDNLVFTITAIVSFAVIITTRIISGFSHLFYIFDIAAVCSLLQSYFNSKHSILGMIFGVVASLMILATDIYQHIWLNSAICAINAILFTIGAIRWHKNDKIDKTKNLTYLKLKGKIIATVSFIVLSVGFAFLLKYLGGNLYYLDAPYSIGCLVGSVLCAKTCIDQFPLYLIADVFGITMYIILSVQNINNISLILTCLIYISFVIIGLIHWIKLVKIQIKEQKELLKTKENQNPQSN